MTGRAIDRARGSSEPLLPASISSYTGVVTPVFAVACQGADRAAGPGLPPGPGPAALSFQDAAKRCGHDPDTTCGAEAARHDLRVWDLVQHSA